MRRRFSGSKGAPGRQRQDIPHDIYNGKPSARLSIPGNLVALTNRPVPLVRGNNSHFAVVLQTLGVPDIPGIPVRGRGGTKKPQRDASERGGGSSSTGFHVLFSLSHRLCCVRELISRRPLINCDVVFGTSSVSPLYAPACPSQRLQPRSCRGPS